MSVEESSNLRILDPRKLDSAARKAIGDLEKIRKRLEKEAKLADKASSSLGGAPTDIQGGGAFRGAFPEKGKVLPSSGLVAGVSPIVKKTNAFKELRDQVNANTSRQDKINEKLDLFSDNLKDIQNVVSDPGGMIFGQIGKMVPKMLLKGGIIGTIVIAVAQQVFEEIKKTFGPGGVNDVRKMVLDETATIPDLENLIAIRNGSVFFTSDVRVRQRVAQSSNTEDLDFQSQRFNEFALGREISAT